MDKEILNRNRGDDDLPPGQADHMADNRPKQELFFEVEGQHREQEDELAFSKSENCGQAMEDLKGVIKRADAVSPQVADVVDKVMSHGLLNHHQEWKNKNYEETPNHQPESLNEKHEQDVNCDSDSYIPSHYQTTRVDGNKEIDNGEDWRHWQQERNLKCDEEKTFSDEGYDKTDYGGQKDLEKNGKVYDDDDDDDDDRENEWNEKYNNSNLNSSFQDDDSNLSSSPFGGSHGNQSAYSHNSYDPVRAPIGPNKEGVYFCHLCSFSGSSQLEFEDHMTCHFEHSCPHCDYKSRTEGRLKRHIKDFHTEDPPDGFGNKRNMGRPKVFRCKQCDFVATEKEEFWAHSRSHIKEDKILQCPRCPFVTEYKHHLEYHLRNHFGSKPFKCNKCNYSCVNKSMLNSHMKSHTNVYQYRCADCTYATKYCHSLKLHLRKYNHKPATVLNSDGSLPQGIDAEASGLSLMQKRGPPRGPRGPRKDKFDPFVGHLLSMPHPGMPGMPAGLNGGMMSPYWPILSQFPNGIQGPPPPLVPVSVGSNLHPQDLHQQGIPALNSSSNLHKAGGNQTNDTPYKCNFCSFASDVKHDLLKHVMKVHAAENQDLFSIFGISSEALLEEQGRRMPYVGHKFMPKIGGMMGSPPKPPTSKMDDTNSPLPLKVKTEPNSSAKTSPHSWPHESSSEPLTPKSSRFEGSSGRYSMPELPISNYHNDGANAKNSESPAGDDIIKQMMFKFGSGMPAPTPRTPRESAPLDLTKRRSPSMSPLPEHYHNTFEARMPEHQNDGNISSGGDGESSAGGEVSAHSPRKRSRKGKAFKLDTLCMKLQEKQTDSQYDSNEEGCSGSDDVEEEHKEDAEDNVGKDMPDVEQREENVKDDDDGDDETKEINSENNDDVLRQIQNDLAILNRREYRPEDDIGQVPEAKKRRTQSFDQAGNEPHSIELADNAAKEKRISTPPVDENASKMSDIKNGLNSAYYANGNKSFSAEIQRRRELEMTWKMLNSIGTHGGHPQLHPRYPVHNGFGLAMMPDKSPVKRQNLTGQLPSPMTSTPNGKNGIPIGKDKYECMYCEIAFRDCVMYTMHMGYHGYHDPFKCNMCGHTSKDKVEFFLHIARAAHN